MPWECQSGWLQGRTLRLLCSVAARRYGFYYRLLYHLRGSRFSLLLGLVCYGNAPDGLVALLSVLLYLQPVIAYCAPIPIPYLHVKTVLQPFHAGDLAVCLLHLRETAEQIVLASCVRLRRHVQKMASWVMDRLQFKTECITSKAMPETTLDFNSDHCTGVVSISGSR